MVGARGRVGVMGNEINRALMVNVMLYVLYHNFTKKGKSRKGLKSPRGRMATYPNRQAGLPSRWQGKSPAGRRHSRCKGPGVGEALRVRGGARGPGSELSPRVVLRGGAQHSVSCRSILALLCVAHPASITMLSRWPGWKSPAHLPPPSDHQHLRQGRASRSLSKGSVWPGALLTGWG